MKITVKEAARLMGKSEMFVRMGLRSGTLEFGIAQKMPNSSKYTYYILKPYINDSISSSFIKEKEYLCCSGKLVTTFFMSLYDIIVSSAYL